MELLVELFLSQTLYYYSLMFSRIFPRDAYFPVAVITRN